MSKNKVLDTALSIIDKHIHLEHKEIVRKIYAETNYCDQDYNRFLAVATSGTLTLRDYIRKRRLYFAVSDLISNPDKPLVQITQYYGYSEQSAFTRAVKFEYGDTPAELRKSKREIPDNRELLEDCLANNSRLDVIMDRLDSDHQLCQSDWHYFEDFIRAADEFGFDVSTCCLISELAEKLSVPFGYLLEQCFEVAINYDQDDEFQADEIIDFMTEMEIESEDELKKLCQYYHCKWYELDYLQVKLYQLGIDSDKELEKIWKYYNCKMEKGDPYPLTQQMVQDYRRNHK